jgi:hypothetical protein
MNARRLLLLADFLEKLPRKRFYYGSWVGEDWKGKQDLSCGTTACALGWAATLPSLRRAGLELRMSKHQNGYVAFRGMRGNRFEPGHHQSLCAAAKVFAISLDDANQLFAAPYPSRLDDDATPKQVARHIRKFVKEGSQEKRTRKKVRSH